VTVGEIRSHPEHFLGKEVIIRGRCMGWRGNCGPPPVTRSDWVLRDRSGCIYVTGTYVPRSLWGEEVIVEGVVEEKDGLIYIRGRRVIRGERVKKGR